MQLLALGQKSKDKKKEQKEEKKQQINLGIKDKSSNDTIKLGWSTHISLEVV